MDLLFVYGTLLLSDNKYGRYLRQNSNIIAEGSVAGTLYNIGTYPGAILNSHSSSSIKGTLLRLHNIRKALPILDEYEGFGEHEFQPNEFVRQVTEINTEAGVFKCWIYLYNHPLNDLELIPSGDYLTFLASQK